jgi:pyoverdine/dityrosine biosynthesis protein Dit1
MSSGKIISWTPTPTRLESLTAELNPGERPGLKREDVYDAEYGLRHSPSSRCALPVDVGPSVAPSEDWVREAFAGLVVGERPRPVDGSRPPRMSSSNGRRPIEITAFPMQRYIEACEEELVFGGLVESVIGDASRPQSEKLVAILSNKSLGNSSNGKNVNAEDLESKLSRCVAERSPIQLLLPALPFKDQCAFRTEAPADHTDLGESAFLVRLHCLALAMNQIHSYDGECIVVSDGTVYAPIFGVDPSAARRYVEHLLITRDRLNLSKSVHIMHLDDLVNLDDRYARAAGFMPFSTVRKRIHHSLSHLVEEHRGTSQAMAVLSYGMKWNLDTSRFLQRRKGDVEEDLWKALRRKRPSANDSPQLRGLTSTIDERSRQAALDYASFNLSMGYTGLLSRYFPDAIRLTSHPKPGQVAAPRFGSVYPWNGVAIADTLEMSQVRMSTISCVEAYTAMRMKLRPVLEQDGQFPICYTK